MVSRRQYHERKEAGLCTKCAKPLGNSISSTRCSECYEKFLTKEEERKQTKIKNKMCLGCSINSPDGNSNYCHLCRQESLVKKQDKEIKAVISQFKEQNTSCRVCNQDINTLGVLCQKCLANVQFTKTDAILRYGDKCPNCEEPDIKKLRIISTDVAKPMEHHGPSLYKVVCYNTTPPKYYKISCYSCYWKSNLEHIMKLRQVFEQKDVTTIDDEEDIIDIDYEESDSTI